MLAHRLTLNGDFGEKLDDKLVVVSQQDALLPRFVEVLSNTPGIAYFNDVVQYPLVDLHDIFEKTKAIWGERLAGKTFAVRCKRPVTPISNTSKLRWPVMS